jgi:type I restriction enzyme R subunit
MSTRGPLEADTCRDYVLPRLRDAGWSDDQIVEQFPVADGRIVPTRGRHRREKPLRADYLLEIAPGLAVAVVEAKREYRLPGDGFGQAVRYATMLDLPLAYSTNGTEIRERDLDTGIESTPSAFPSPSDAWLRYRRWKGLAAEADPIVRQSFSRVLRNPDGSVKEPRYYQRVAIERALEAILGGRRRVLLTMATGTGKTFVALQLIWKLWHGDWPANRKPRVLYLADRRILVDQPYSREFQPVFGDALWRIQGEVRTSREIYFGLYQGLADAGEGEGLLRAFDPEFFDLIVVDECHRGSARDESSWRSVLDRFEGAVQVGMTATPLRTDNVDSYRYFGDPVYTYTLAEGIENGFLAPYRVRRVVLSPDAHGWSPSEGQVDRYGREIPTGLYGTAEFERVVSLLDRTKAAARHLTDYLRRTDPMAKTIVFCVDSEHAEQMRAALAEANADLVRRHPDYVVRIVSDEGDVGREHLGNLIDVESPTPVIATTSKLLGTGVDIPTLRNVVLFKPIGSIVDFKQIIGRGTRLFPDEDKLSFDILDYSGATVLFEDEEFDGVPESITVEEIDDDGDVVVGDEVAEPEPEYGDDEDVTPPSRAKKLYVDGLEVSIAVEGVYLPDAESGRLRLVEYADYAADEVRRLFGGADELRTRWRTHDGRDAVVDALAGRGIDVAELAERTGLGEADPLDLLVHVAWNGPATSRRQRAQSVRRQHEEFFARREPEAREILEELLEKYAEWGVSQLDDLGVLEVPPISDHGTPLEIASRFGSAQALRETVDALVELLYAAQTS